MSREFSVSREENGIAIKISGISETEIEHVVDRASELKTVLFEMVTFDAIVSGTQTSMSLEHFRACQAVELKYQILLEALREHTELCTQIANGDENISNHGFPELLDSL